MFPNYPITSSFRPVWGPFVSSWPSTSPCKPSIRSSTLLPRPTTCLPAGSPSRLCSAGPTELRPVWRLSTPSASRPGMDTVLVWRWSVPGAQRTPGAFWNQPSVTTTLVSSSLCEADDHSKWRRLWLSYHVSFSGVFGERADVRCAVWDVWRISVQRLPHPNRKS